MLNLLTGCAGAAGDLTRQEPVVVELKLGQPSGEHRFTPDSLVFETGKLYVLRLENPSPNAYYFGSQGLADAVYSRKVVALGSGGRVLAEVYGPVRRVELKPGRPLTAMATRDSICVRVEVKNLPRPWETRSLVPPTGIEPVSAT